LLIIYVFAVVSKIGDENTTKGRPLLYKLKRGIDAFS
jgi:hypothetical protein